VRLLFDNNLSPRLSAAVADLYPDSVHVRALALQRAPDDDVWEYAREHGYVIVSKDSDFHQRSLVEGFPPKIVWIQRGNCTTAAIIELLRRSGRAILDFEQDEVASFLILE
jgi:predicted nuclease of predicted toxin-antitoxin system